MSETLDFNHFKTLLRAADAAEATVRVKCVKDTGLDAQTGKTMKQQLS